MLKYMGKTEEKTDTVKSLDDQLANTVKFVSKDYICYRREWLYENLELEFEHLKKMKERTNGRILSSENEK